MTFNINFGKLIPIIIAGGLAVYQEIVSQQAEEKVEELEERIKLLEKR